MTATLHDPAIDLLWINDPAKFAFTVSGKEPIGTLAIASEGGAPSLLNAELALQASIADPGGGGSTGGELPGGGGGGVAVEGVPAPLPVLLLPVMAGFLPRLRRSRARRELKPQAC